jgi:hypothetical protein
MAWNQVSIFLFAPGTRPAVKTDPTAKTCSGEPLKIIGGEVDDGHVGDRPNVTAVEAWLVGRGFQVSERSNKRVCLVRGQGPCNEPEIEFYLGLSSRDGSLAST